MPARSSSRRRSAERAGRLAEEAAALYLMLKGYRILARRFAAPGGEIDLVCRRGKTLVFVEVKLRATTEEARLAVTPHNMRRIRSAAGHWLARRSRTVDVPMRFDIVACAPRKLVHFRDAFR